MSSPSESQEAIDVLIQASWALQGLPNSLYLLFFDDTPEEVAKRLKRYPSDGGLFTPPDEILALLDCCERFAKASPRSSTVFETIKRVRLKVSEAAPFYNVKNGGAA